MEPVFLIYEEVPETTKFYIFPAGTLTTDEYTRLHRCHGKYRNTARRFTTDWTPDERAAVDELSDWLETQEDRLYTLDTPLGISAAGLGGGVIIRTGFYL